MRRIAFVMGVCFLAATWVGCGVKGEAPKSKTEVSQAAAGNLQLTIGDEKDFAAKLESLKGKVVLVDYWATWCGPCVASFPHTVDIGKKYADKGLAVITISFDEPSDEKEVRAFLAQHDAGDFVNMLSSYNDASTEEADGFKVEGFPTLRLFDKSGKQVWESLGAPSGADEQLLHERIEKLLAEGGA
ncbi:MAG: TlpA family protein disulfide reductase [Planctomycetaceae bacterium]